MTLTQLYDHTANCPGRAVDIAKEAHLTVASIVGNRDRDLQLRGVQTDIDLAILSNGSSPV